MWEEPKAPDFILEVASPGTWEQDRGPKRILYEQLGVHEYWRFDPQGELFEPRLQGLRLRSGHYRPIAPSPQRSATAATCCRASHSDWTFGQTERACGFTTPRPGMTWRRSRRPWPRDAPRRTARNDSLPWCADWGPIRTRDAGLVARARMAFELELPLGVPMRDPLAAGRSWFVPIISAHHPVRSRRVRRVAWTKAHAPRRHRPLPASLTPDLRSVTSRTTPTRRDRWSVTESLSSPRDTRLRQCAWTCYGCWRRVERSPSHRFRPNLRDLLMRPTSPHPDEIHYPSSDGQPVAENSWQWKAMHHAFAMLDAHYASRADVYVIGDLLIYYEEGDPAKSVAPDVFVVFGAAKHERMNYRLWEEPKAPDFVLQVASPGTWKEDRGPKRALYEQLGVQEYWRFDPRGDLFEPTLQGLYLQAGRYRKVPSRLQGGRHTLHSDVLGLDLRAEGTLVRFRDPAAGRDLETFEETAAARRAAESRAERLAALVRRLGADPDA